MTTLMEITTPDGHRHRCDAACYNAHAATCTCICAADNHGVGRVRAMANIRSYGAAMLRRAAHELNAQQPLRTYIHPAARPGDRELLWSATDLLQ